MVEGLDTFRGFFRDYENYYCLIGGTATMEWLTEAGLETRRTKDLDIVLIVESLDARFLRRFWEFVKSGNYQNLKKSTGERIYYRFSEPGVPNYPSMLEIFSRKPDGLVLWGDPEIIPIPAGDDASSLSAVLMNNDYYELVRDHRVQHDGLSILSADDLILLKARAWLDLSNRKQAGVHVDEKDIRKHRNDIFRLAMTLPIDEPVRIKQSIYDDLTAFMQTLPAGSAEWAGIRAALGRQPKAPSPQEFIDLITTHFTVTDHLSSPAETI